MIRSFIKIGEHILNGNISKKNILKHISINPKTQIKDKKGNRYDVHPIIIDFNLNNHSFEIRRDEEIKRRKDYFILKKQSSSGPKITMNTDNISYHIYYKEPAGPTPVGIITKAEKSNFKFSEAFIKILRSLKTFYVKINSNKEKKLVLNPKYLSESKKRMFLDAINETLKNKKKETSELQETGKAMNYKEKDLAFKAYEKMIDSLLSIPSSLKGYPRYAFIYINGKSIFETEFADEYVNFLYYAYISERFYKNAKKDKKCYFCGKQTTVTNDVSTPFKVYNIDKPGFFENKNQKNAYKSFSLCEDCYVKLLAGINYVKQKLSSRFLGTDYILIPKSDEFFEDFNNNMNYLTDIINTDLTMDKVVRESIRYNYLVDLLFYVERNSSFKVIKYIPDIEFKHLLLINDLFDKINYEINKEFPRLKIKLWLIDFNKIFFSKSDEKKSKSIIFDIIDAVYKRYPIDIEVFFEQFLSNYKKEYFSNKKNNNNYFNSFAALFLYEFLLKIGIVEVKNMETNHFSKIKNKDLIDFFDKHKEIDSIRKGFVVLGYLINKIVCKQWEQKKSSSFLDKIDYDGYDKQDLIELLNDITDYFNMYKNDIYLEPDLNTYAFEIVSKYINGEESISPEEISFYILLGINLGGYIGGSYSKSKEGETKNGN